MSLVQRFEIKNKLGEGISAQVFRAIDNQRGEFVALKKMSLDKENEGVPSPVIREVALLKKLNHPNIISLRDVIHQPNQIILVLEYLDCNLKEYTEKSQMITHEIVADIVFQLFNAIHYIHSENVIHRDIKPQNILVGTSPNTTVLKIKIADFGLAREVGIATRALTPEVVTLWYRPPDVLCGHNDYSYDIDIWSTGCVIAELYLGQPLFMGKCNEETLEAIIELLGSPTKENWPLLAKVEGGFEKLRQGKKQGIYERKDLNQIWADMPKTVIDLISKCLVYECNLRISAEEALKHDYFEEYNNKIEQNEFLMEQQSDLFKKQSNV